MQKKYGELRRPILRVCDKTEVSNRAADQSIVLSLQKSRPFLDSVHQDMSAHAILNCKHSVVRSKNNNNSRQQPIRSSTRSAHLQKQARAASQVVRQAPPMSQFVSGQS
jgi:hypothetical protein